MISGSKIEMRKEQDRERHFLKYWKTRHNVILKPEQIEEFKKHEKIIKKVLPILGFLKEIGLFDEE
jgi:hypothetical protein